MNALERFKERARIAFLDYEASGVSATIDQYVEDLAKHIPRQRIGMDRDELVKSLLLAQGRLEKILEAEKQVEADNDNARYLIQIESHARAIRATLNLLLGEL